MQELIGAVEDAKKAAAKGEDAVVHVVSAWATRALLAELEIEETRKRCHFFTSDAPLPLAVEKAIGWKATGNPNEWSTAFSRVAKAVYDTAKDLGFAVGSFPTEDECLAYLKAMSKLVK